MGGSIDTGPGGFEIDGQTYTMDTGMPEASGGPQGPRAGVIDVSEAFVDANGKPRDLTRRTRTTLAQYLSDVTTGRAGAAGAPNRYPIDRTALDASTTAPDGGPSLRSPGAGAPRNSSAFLPDPALVDPPTPAATFLASRTKKGRGAPTGVDGNDILAGVAGNATTGPAVALRAVPGHVDTSAVVAGYTSSVLQQNRFSASTTFSDGPSGASGFNPELRGPGGARISVERLAAVGPLLTMRAGSEFGSADPGADPSSVGEQAGALLPGPAQLGASRVDVRLLEAADVLQQLTEDELSPEGVASFGSSSWGQLNNVDDPFSGIDAVGMVVLSTALLAGLELVVGSLGSVLGLITPGTKRPARDAQGRYSLGEYITVGKQAKKEAAGGLGGSVAALTSLNFSGLLGIQPTHFPFNRALTVGLNAFFGITVEGEPGLGSIGAELAGSLASSLDSPGFNVVVARAIVRSSLTVVDQLKKVGGNPINAATQALALLDVIRSSKLVAACNVFAMLGDAALSSVDDFVDRDASGGTKVSAMDARSDVVGGAVGKSRLRGSLKLAWASNTAPASVLLPANVLGASLAFAGSRGMGQFNPFLGVRSDPYSQLRAVVGRADAGPRIEPEVAARFEDELGASYVPFYFHDLRTNEMIGFHAFLASLSDDYTAAYERSKGFGRVEAVKVYEGTERRIGMSFYVAATSLADFDEMWVKLNKLVTMVYPQYTPGIQLSSADGTSYRFTQPFSQLIGASPLIRIRLGDLLRSNFSLFALGRLFGMGDKSFTVDGKTFQGADSIDQDAVDRLSAALQQIMLNPNGETYVPCTGLYDLVDGPGGGSGGGLNLPLPAVVAPSGDGPRFAPRFDPSTHFGGIFEVKVTGTHPTNPTMVVGTVQFAVELMANRSGRMQREAAAEFDNPSRPLQRVIGGSYAFPIASLIPTDATRAAASKNAATVGDALGNVSSLNGDFVAAATAFLSPAAGGNAVARSFRDTAGKGLAGVIETMHFDWYDKVTWETQYGRTAPKICKVTIAFSPVHDISPGLDHNGFNRAPVYPVGGMGQQE